jgi:formylglycine-generating enzyme required for sulfatase activity
MIDELRPPKVFISAVTSEFATVRERLTQIFDSHGANVVVQHPYPNRLSGGSAIADEIKTSDLAVYIIGFNYGAPLPAGDPAKGVPDWYSWTQWECHARKSAKDYLLFFYNGPPIGKPECEEYSARQTRFREDIAAEEKSSIAAAKFRFWFKTPGELESCIVRFIESADGALALFRAGTWAKIRASYRHHAVKAWQRDFPDVYRGKRETSQAEKERLLAADHAPFIASQKFSILVPKAGKQLHALRPSAFLPGRSSETEALAREDTTWNPVARETLKQALLNGKSGPGELGGVKISRPLRLFLVSGGGIGKTTNMRWLDATLNGPDNRTEPPPADAELHDDQDQINIGNAKPSSAKAPLPTAENYDGVLAIKINAGALLNLNDDEILTELTARIAAEVGVTESKWPVNAIAEGLRQDALAQRLIFLIDGLDHVEVGKIPFFRSIQSQAPGRRWSQCCVIAAGRPHAIQGWKEGVAISEDAVSISQWRFLEPSEFESDEAEVFLGLTENKSRYGLVAKQLSSLARVPRVLEYVRTLGEERLEGVRTSADIYERSLRELIKRTLKNGGKDPRMIGPQWQEDFDRDEPPGRQVNYIMKFLSVLAFLSLCPTTEVDLRDTAGDSIRSEAFRMSISEDVRRFIRERLVEPGQALYATENLERDFQALAGFALFVGNGVLDATDSNADNFNSLVWSNRTIQQFLAAYWYAVHAGGFDALVKRHGGETVHTTPEDPRRDAERLRHYIFYPEDVRSDVTYELNMFLAEMPPLTPLNPSSWVASAAAWYDPELHRGGTPGAASARRWSTEMLYRSWATMHDIAGRPFDDWWDLSYQSLIENAPGTARAKASLHRQRDQSGLDQNSAASRLARNVLDRFHADFGNILEGNRGAAQQVAAQQMIDAKNWLSVPRGQFEMGAPPARQGFPPKVRAYWIRDLDDVQIGRRSAEAAARRSTKREWFTGVQGKALRDVDIQWLTETFRPVEPSADAARSDPNRNAPEYERALQILEEKWSRRDESPSENPQHVAPFVMHRLPILHRWYYLFAPGYRGTVASYLKPTRHPPDDHPATYASWYDAWAFCQWATWTVGDPAAGGRRKYRLRLPHEAEWEYAARWNKNRAGRPERVAYGQRYWWGDKFYKHEDPDDKNSAKPEPISNKRAHAIGSPGRTRAPLDAAPNGLGFHDILGNVWEWTANVYETRREGEEKDDDIMKYSRVYPTDRPPVNCSRTMRGGLWYYLDLLANCTARFRLSSDDRDYKMGFRVVREEH